MLMLRNFSLIFFEADGRLNLVFKTQTKFVILKFLKCTDFSRIIISLNYRFFRN